MRHITPARSREHRDAVRVRGVPRRADRVRAEPGDRHVLAKDKEFVAWRDRASGVARAAPRPRARRGRAPRVAPAPDVRHATPRPRGVSGARAEREGGHAMLRRVCRDCAGLLAMAVAAGGRRVGPARLSAARGQRVSRAHRSCRQPTVFRVLAYGYADAVVHDAVLRRVARDVAARPSSCTATSRACADARAAAVSRAGDPTGADRSCSARRISRRRRAARPTPHVADDPAARALHRRDDARRRGHRQDVRLHVSVRRPARCGGAPTIRSAKSAAWCSR